MKVTFSGRFTERYLDFDDAVRDIITEFIIYVEKYGLRGLEGRNKSSAPQNPHTKKELANLLTPKNIAYGIITSAYRIMLAMRVIKLRNMSCIIKDLMIRLCY